MKIIFDPHGTATELMAGARIRFEFAPMSYIDVYRDPHNEKSLTVHSEGFGDKLVIMPRVSNEVQISLQPHR